MINILMILIIVIFVGVMVMAVFRKPSDSVQEEKVEDYNLGDLEDSVIACINDVLKLDIDMLNLKPTEAAKQKAIKTTIRNSLKVAPYGDIGSKDYLKEYIEKLMQQQCGVDSENIDLYYPYYAPSTQEKFEIILYYYQKLCANGELGSVTEHYAKLIPEDAKLRTKKIKKICPDDPNDSLTKVDALITFIDDFDLVRDRYDDDGNLYYEISKYDIKEAYDKLDIQLDYEDKLHILAQRIYQDKKGHSVADDIRDMTIDGVSGGVSGIASTMYTYGRDLSYNKDDPNRPLTAYNSVWCMVRGKNVRMSFVGFGSSKELQRVCKNIYKYGSPGQLSADVGCKVNEMYDGSRVTVARPPMADDWCFWVRKFGSAGRMTINDLITGENSELMIASLRWLIRGCRTLILTGGQGCGKSTMLASLLQFISKTKTLRIQEMMFELQLRKAFAERNIVSFKETQTIPGQVCLDFQKKTDGNITVLGEVAQDSVADQAIQIARVGSDSLLATHHARTARAMVLAFRDSIIRHNNGGDVKIIESNAAEALNFNLHLTKDVDGFRHIVRLTEIVPADIEDYPADLDEATIEHYRRVTDRPTFETPNILTFYKEYRTDKDGNQKLVHGFKVVGTFSAETRMRIRENLQANELSEFDSYLEMMDYLYNEYLEAEKNLAS